MRRRLTFAFAFVALAAVGLTTWFTLGAVFEAQQELFQSGASTAAESRTAEVEWGPFWWRGRDWRGGPGLAPQHEAFMHITRTAFLAGLLSFVMAVIAAAVFTRFLTRPLVALTKGAKRLEAGERGIRLKLPAARDELRSLTEAFNGLVAGLERQETWRRNMTADIAHDLRTPLAVLRSEIEGMQDGVVPRDEASLSRLHSEVMMLSRLVDDLRTLSLSEGGGLSLQTEEVALELLLLRSIDSFSSRAAQAGVELKLEPVESGLSARLDPGHISRVLANLLDNALRYASPGVVELGAEPEENGVRLWVHDHGPGLPEGTLERVFERFYRGDPSRTRNRAKQNDAAGGSGLGLAIAKAIVEAHGGRLEAANHPSGGAVFTLHLPESV